MKKTIVIGVTSSVAAFKSVQLVSDLLKKGYDVEVIMSKNATNFIQPLTFSSLTKHKTYVDTFDRVDNYEVEHISLAKKADVFAIIPASANVIAKVANGICDDMLTTTFLACNCKKIIAPAMNTQMYDNPVTQDNLKKCRDYGYEIVEPTSGLLACGDNGKGKLADIDVLIDAIEQQAETDQCLKGKKVLISAGPTKEKIDPVRFISNHSSGKMGYAIAKQARNMGADVTIVSGPVSLKEPRNIKVIHIESANDMFEAFKANYEEADYIIKAAAVADLTPAKTSEQKMKKLNASLSMELKKTQDILAYLGEHKTHQKICGFAMETENAIENGKEKCIRKNCDMLVVNNLNTKGAGFQGDTNVVTILTKDTEESLELMTKDDLGKIILKKLISL